MKASVGLVLFAVVLCHQALAQKGKDRCPSAENVFGICTFDPKVNCLEDSDCQGGQLCCPNGCNKICKKPVSDDESSTYAPVALKSCPKPSQSNSFGICSFDASKNCLADNECKNGQMCCPEGCNKVCKEPVTFQHVKPKGPAFVPANNQS